MPSAAGGPQQARRPKGTPSLPPKNPRDRMGVTISYRGGPEAWWQIEARGRVWRRPGCLALHDVLQEIYEGRGGKLPE